MSEDYIEAVPRTELVEKMTKVARRLAEMGEGITLDKAVSDSLCSIQDIAADLRQMHYPLVQGPSSNVVPIKSQKKATIGLLSNALLDVLTVYHVCELTPPSMDEVEASVEDVEDSIKVSGVLIASLLSMSSSEALVNYFVDDGVFEDDTVLLLHEIVVAIYVFCQKVDADFYDLA